MSQPDDRRRDPQAAVPATPPPAAGLRVSGVKFTREANWLATFDLFVSSASELASTRALIDKLLNEAINPSLRDKVRAELVLQVWEREQAQQQQPGRNVNEIFVQRALDSHGALALFLKALRPGTKEEVEALVSASEEDWDNRTHLSVLRFACPPSEPREPELDEFFSWLNDHGVYWQDTEELGSDSYWLGLVKVLTGYALAAFEAASSGTRNDVY